MAVPKENSRPTGTASQDSPAGEDLYKTLSEAIPGLMWICDAEGYCNYASARCREYTGADFLNPRGNGGFGFSHPEESDQVQKAWIESVKSGRAHEAELRLRRHDGTYRWHRAYGVPERDDRQAIR